MRCNGPKLGKSALGNQIAPFHEYLHLRRHLYLQKLCKLKLKSLSFFQTIPQYSIPCHSSSNVVVEPSGLLELNNFTSQRLDDEETAMEQDVDSSTEDGTEPSPSQSSAEQS